MKKIQDLFINESLRRLLMHEPTQPFQWHANNFYILGAWLSYERAKLGYSLRGLARGSNVVPSLISAIENQKSRAHLDTLKNLFESMHYSFVTDENYLSSIYENINALYYSVYDQNERATHHLYNAIKPQFASLKYSPLTVDLILAEAFAGLHIHKTEVSKAFLALDNHLEHLSLIQIQRYYLNLGYYYLALKDKKSAENAFIKVIECHRESRAHAVALMNLAQLASKRFAAVKAAEYAYQSSALHARYSNLFRKVEADFIAIKSHIELNQLSQAESIIGNLSYVLVKSNQRYWPGLETLKAFLNYRKGEYIACIEKLNSLPEKDFMQSILLAQAYYQNADVEAAYLILHSLQSEYPKASSPTKYHIIQLFMSAFETPLAQLSESIDYFIRHVHDFEHLHVIQSLIHVIGKVAHKQENIETLYQLHKISLSLMQFDKNIR